MNGIEAIKAMMEGKTVEVTKAVGKVAVGKTYKFNDKGELVMVSGTPSVASFNDFLASEFEEVLEYPLTFLEAMQAINEGKKVVCELYDSLVHQKDEVGRIFYLDCGGEPKYVGFNLEEVEAKWKIVEE